MFRAGHEFVDHCRSKEATAAMLIVLRSSEVDWPVKIHMARLVQTAVSRFRFREFGRVRATIEEENLIDERQVRNSSSSPSPTYLIPRIRSRHSKIRIQSLTPIFHPLVGPVGVREATADNRLRATRGPRMSPPNRNTNHRRPSS